MPTDFDMSAMKVRRDDLNLAILIDAAQKRFEWINERSSMTITTGIMTFTPDGKPFCGKLPDINGLFHCAGFCGHGIVTSPAIGVIMSQIILDGQSSYNIDEIEADRFFDMPGYQDRDEIAAKCSTMYGSYYGKVEGKAATSQK